MQWLIDGHNLIGQIPTLQLDDPHDEEKLLEYLRRYRARTGHTITVVFDPGYTYRPAKIKKRGGITVQFAPHGKTADQIIIRRLKRIKNPRGVRVVSSDQAVQRAARFAGVQIIPSQRFAQELLSLAPPSDTEQDSRADLKLSADEVEAWLEIFNQAKNEHT